LEAMAVIQNLQFCGRCVPMRHQHLLGLQNIVQGASVREDEKDAHLNSETFSRASHPKSTPDIFSMFFLTILCAPFDLGAVFL
jgi:hypothetical protein